MTFRKDPRLPWSDEAADRPHQACPFLGFESDVEVRYGYPESGNYCHRVKPPQPAALSQQEAVCLAGEYRLCPVNSDEWRGPLPADLRGEDSSASRPGRRFWLWLAAAGSLVVVLLLAYFFYSRNASTLPPTPTLLPPQATTSNPQAAILDFSTPTITSQPTAIPNSPTPTATISATPTLTPTITSTPTITPTPTILTPTATVYSSPTAGPLQETPFGPEGRYLVHIVGPGETIDHIAGLYATNVKVLQIINLTAKQPIFYAGQAAVVAVGETDPTKVFPMQAVWLAQRMQLADLAQKYAASEEDLRTLNALGPGDTVPGGRWIVARKQ